MTHKRRQIVEKYLVTAQFDPKADKNSTFFAVYIGYGTTHFY